MKLSFSLNKPKQPTSTPSIGASVFATADDDDRIDAAPTSSFANHDTAGNKKHLAHGIESTKDKRKRTEAEKMEEVYDYDGAWDRIQAERQRQKEAKDSEARERKVSCPNHFFSLYLRGPSAEVHPWSLVVRCNTKARSSACRRKDDSTGTGGRR